MQGPQAVKPWGTIIIVKLFVSILLDLQKAI